MDGKTVKVSDRTFAILYDAKAIDTEVRRVAMEIKRDVAGRHPLFVCVLNGAFMFAADVLRLVDEACEIRFVRLSSYSGTESTGTVHEVLGLDADIEGRDIVVIEDIVETGRTMHSFLEEVKRQNPASVSIAALVVKPEKMEEYVDVKYAGFTMKAGDFIVGYGLDYNQEGRNLPDIYILKE